MADVSVKSVVRVLLIVVAVAIALYLIYRLRKPIGWVAVSIFLAIALSRPVNALNRRMRRGFAIALVYLGLLAIPALLIALIVPPLVTEATNFANNAPRYAGDVTDFVEKNETLRKLNKDYKLTDKLKQEAAKLPTKLGGAAGTLRDVGFGIANSIFALVTILVLTAFLLGSGRRWVDAAVALQPPERRDRLARTLDRIAAAVGGYVAGALLIAAIAGITGYIVMTILGLPFRAPLAVIVGFFSLIPLVGATVAAVIVGIVTLFHQFPTATIAWTLWAIIYQQFENHFIQPQVQRRTVDLHPFVVIVAVLFGGTLFGIPGAIVAIPVAASIQIVLREYWDWRRFEVKADPVPPPRPPPPTPATGGAAPA